MVSNSCMILSEEENCKLWMCVSERSVLILGIYDLFISCHLCNEVILNSLLTDVVTLIVDEA